MLAPGPAPGVVVAFSVMPVLITGEVNVFPVRVCVAPRVTTVSPVSGKAKLCASAPAVNVMVLATVRVFDVVPPAMVKPVVAAVNVNPLIFPRTVTVPALILSV